MTTKRLALMLAVTALLVAALPALIVGQERPTTAQAATAAQTPTPAAKPEPAAPTPRPEGQPVNIKIEITITEQPETGVPRTKMVSMIAADRQMASVRSESQGTTVYADARPNLIAENRLRLEMSLDVRLSVMEGTDRRLLSVRETLPVIVESGKSMIVSQAADPTTNRRVTIEVKATVLR